MICLPCRFFASAAPNSARLLDSVPPEVKIISFGSHFKDFAITALAYLIYCSARMPLPCSEEGFPYVSESIETIFRIAFSLTFVVALLSRYAVMILLPPGAHRYILTDKADQFVARFQNNHLLILFLCKIEEVQFRFPIQKPVHPLKSRHIEIPPESI